MSKSGKWKSKLLSSSLPLEFEAAKQLVTMGFSVSADYKYARNDLGTLRDFSVDIHATSYTPFSNPNKISPSLELLVECKYRTRNRHWLFFPDPNKEDFAPFTVGETVRAIDNFSMKYFKSNTTVEFDLSLPFCYKGIEVNETSDNVYEAEFQHGNHQLQYALPQLLIQTASFNVGQLDEGVPFLFCPILLSTAQLFVVNRQANIELVERSSSLVDLAQLVPYLVFYSDYGPDFEIHCKQQSKLLKNYHFNNLSVVDEHRLENGEYEFKLPSSIFTDLIDANRSRLHSYFTQFVVCNIQSFPILLENLKVVASKSACGIRTKKEDVFTRHKLPRSV